MSPPPQPPPWDSERGQQRWWRLTESERQVLLATHDRLLLAAQNIRLTASGQAVYADNWRPIKSPTFIQS